MTQQINRELIVSSFKTLCIAPTTNYKRIRKAYLKQSKIWHPDRNRDSEAGKQILKINEAYTYLRLFFDQKGQLNDTSGIVRSLLQAKEYSIKTNHRTEIKTRLIAFYRGGLAYEKNTSTRTVENIVVYINFFVSLVNLIILPPLLIWKMGWNGLLLALTINVLLILFTMSAFRNLHKIRWFSNFYK
jgi:hypothetical protein